jgi:hypothetical protein
MSRKVQCAAQASGLPALSMSSGVRVARTNLGHGVAGFCLRSTSGDSLRREGDLWLRE